MQTMPAVDRRVHPFFRITNEDDLGSTNDGSTNLAASNFLPAPLKCDRFWVESDGRSRTK